MEFGSNRGNLSKYISMRKLEGRGKEIQLLENIENDLKITLKPVEEDYQ